MKYSNSLCFLGYEQHPTLPQTYVIGMRVNLKKKENYIYKCDVTVEKKDNLYHIVSVENLEKKKREDVFKYDLPWISIHKVSQEEQKQLTDMLWNHKAFQEVLNSEKWLLNIKEMNMPPTIEEKEGKLYAVEKINNHLSVIPALIHLTLDNGEMFSLEIDIHEYNEENYIENIRAVKDQGILPNDRQKDRQDTCLGQILSKKILKIADKRVRLSQILY